jgi:sugar phosphate isomerase/epimerase
MYTNLNPRTMGLNHHNFASLLTAAYKNGFKGIEVPSGAFEKPEAARDAAKRMNDLGMHFGLIMAPCDMYKVDDDAFGKALLTFGRWAELASIAGCTRAFNHIWPGNDERAYDENFEWHIKRLTAIYKVLNDHDIRYGLEFMGPKTVRDGFKHEFIHSLIGIISLVNEVDARIGFVFDTFHWYCSGSNSDDLHFVAHHPDRIINLHLADANGSYSWEDQIDNQRAMPKENGIIDVISMLRLLDQSGYNGPVIIEPMKPTTDRYARMALDNAVHDAISCLHDIFTTAGVIDD